MSTTIDKNKLAILKVKFKRGESNENNTIDNIGDIGDLGNMDINNHCQISINPYINTVLICKLFLLGRDYRKLHTEQGITGNSSLREYSGLKYLLYQYVHKYLDEKFSLIRLIDIDLLGLQNRITAYTASDSEHIKYAAIAAIHSFIYEVGRFLNVGQLQSESYTINWTRSYVWWIVEQELLHCLNVALKELGY